MMALKYDEITIKKIKNNFDYKTNIENPYLIERSTEIIDDNFLAILKIIEQHEKKIAQEIKKYNPKLNKTKGYQKYYGGDKNKGKKNFDFLRIPKERPVTFLNKKTGKEDELKKEINSNLNKLSPGNSQKIFTNVIQLYQDNLDCFDYHHFIDILFDKAVMQPIYCPLYVRLFMELRKKYLINLKSKLDENREEEDLNDDLSSLIRDKCNLFMNMITDFKNQQDAVLNVNDYDDFCEKNKEKVYKKGFSQFIGELYKNRFVDSDYLSQYLNALSNNIIGNLNQNNTQVENASICLVQLMDTAINKRLFKNDKCWDRIKEIKDHPVLPKKLKFKFMDLLGV
jgi:hypothetical protein